MAPSEKRINGPKVIAMVVIDSKIPLIDASLFKKNTHHDIQKNNPTK